MTEFRDVKKKYVSEADDERVSFSQRLWLFALKEALSLKLPKFLA
jgi:hypothetical protein